MSIYSKSSVLMKPAAQVREFKNQKYTVFHFRKQQWRRTERKVEYVEGNQTIPLLSRCLIASLITSCTLSNLRAQTLKYYVSFLHTGPDNPILFHETSNSFWKSPKSFKSCFSFLTKKLNRAPNRNTYYTRGMK